MLLQNVADKVDRPKKNDFQPVFLSAEEMQKMFEALRGTRLKLPVLVAAVCGVGMGETGSQTEDLRKSNSLPMSLPVFCLQGGFDIKKLRGVYKMMMTVMAKTVGGRLAEKKERTNEENDMLDLVINGGSRVSEENLQVVLDWYEAGK